MPYEAHPQLIIPDELNTKIWRYMNFTKFVSMLEHEALYFSRLDVFAEKDPYEGLYTNANVRLYDIEYTDVPEEIWRAKGIEDEKTWNMIRGVQASSRDFHRMQREMSFANSWNLSEAESAAMWPLYVDGTEGIAVQSTVGRLINSIKDYEEFNVFIGEVQYLDYNAEMIPEGQSLFPLMSKRKSFEHERELRALIWTLQHGKNSINENRYADVKGITVPVDLNELIDRIYVAPASPIWFEELVTSVMKRYQLSKETIQSDLLSDPLY